MKINLKKTLKSFSFYRRVIIILLLILILFRPTINSETANQKLTNLNIWFIVDATGSMVAKDVENGNSRRFEKIKEDITSIVSNLSGAKYGLIVQDYSSYIASPISSNASAIISAESYVRPKYSFYSQPSDLSKLLEFASEKILSYKSRHPERNNVIVFMSDGEDVSGKELEIPSDLASNTDGAFILGYGSIEGTKIEEIGGTEENGWDDSGIKSIYVIYYGDDKNIEIDSSHNVISKINENNLKLIAEKTGGLYIHRETGSAPTKIIEDFKSVARKNNNSSGSEKSVNVGAETYWIFAIILLILLLFEAKEILSHILLELEKNNAKS